MESRIAKELKLRYKPVALLFTDEKPTGALEFKEADLSAGALAVCRGRRQLVWEFQAQAYTLCRVLWNRLTDSIAVELSTRSRELAPQEAMELRQRWILGTQT